MNKHHNQKCSKSAKTITPGKSNIAKTLKIVIYANCHLMPGQEEILYVEVILTSCRQQTSLSFFTILFLPAFMLFTETLSPQVKLF